MGLREVAKSTVTAGGKQAATVDTSLLTSQLKRTFPMMVLPIKNVLALQRFKTHEELKQQLVEVTDGMKVIFVSQTWLAKSHNDDAANSKCTLLKELLRKGAAGELKVNVRFEVVLHGMDKPLRIKTKTLQKDWQDAYVWLDLWSVPQADREGQMRAIASLSTYVTDSAYFLCLVSPSHVHEDGTRRDFNAWNRRGWCGLEVSANWLSLNQKPVLVPEGTSLGAHMAGGPAGSQCFDAPICLNNFSVDSDREVVGEVLESLISARINVALAAGDEAGLVWYRFLRAYRKTILRGTSFGEKVADEASLEEWMAAMRFESVHDNKRSGLTPLRFAVLAGRVDLVKQLLDAGADVHAPLARNWNQQVPDQTHIVEPAAVSCVPSPLPLPLSHSARSDACAV